MLKLRREKRRRLLNWKPSSITLTSSWSTMERSWKIKWSLPSDEASLICRNTVISTLVWWPTDFLLSTHLKTMISLFRLLVSEMHLSSRRPPKLSPRRRQPTTRTTTRSQEAAAVPTKAEATQQRLYRVPTRLRRVNEVPRSSRNDIICQCNVSETNYKIITIFFIEQHKN